MNALYILTDEQLDIKLSICIHMDSKCCFPIPSASEDRTQINMHHLHINAEVAIKKSDCNNPPLMI